MIEHTIDDSEVGGYFKAVTLSIAKIVSTADWTAASTVEAKAALSGMNATALKPYANTYTGFSITVGAQGRISAEAPEDVSELNAMATDAIPFNVIIDNQGAASVSVSTFYASVIGQNNMYGTETATFSVTK